MTDLEFFKKDLGRLVEISVKAHKSTEKSFADSAKRYIDQGNYFMAMLELIAATELQARGKECEYMLDTLDGMKE